MANVVARLIVGQRVIRIVACDRGEECGGKLHLHIQVVENGRSTEVGQIHGENTEAIILSGKLMRTLAIMVHGDGVAADILFVRADDEVGVLPGTKPIKA